MGQYHHIVNMDATQHINPHELGCGLKAWEQSGGGVPAVLALLLADHPGNMPADMGHHPMAGKWAGQRILAVGDYAEKGDIRKFEGLPLDKVYSLCNEAPKLEDYTDTVTYKVPGSSSSYGESMRHHAGPGARRHVETAEKQFNEAMKGLNKSTCNGKYELFSNVSPMLRGALEFALSVRLCGSFEIPVKPYAERGPDEHLHYVLPARLAMPRTEEDRRELAYIWRIAGLGGWNDGPQPPRVVAQIQPDGSRWPWDRPPSDLSWHDATDADQDLGQTRVFANLTLKEYFDPRAFGEVPTTLGIMRAAGGRDPRHCIDMLIGGSAGVQTNVKSGSNDLSSAGALVAMLFHPEPRGGGDISPDDFSEVGRWRNCNLALTSEREADALPSTEQAMRDFTNISDKVLKAATQLANA